MMRCKLPHFPKSDDVVLASKGSFDDATTCLRLQNAFKPQGRLSTFTSRKDSNRKGLALCIAGITQYSRIGVEAILREFTELRLSHLYVGLNTEDSALREQYLYAFKGFASRVSVSLAPVGPKLVAFTQGKLPFYNECLFHGKYHGDRLLGVWDMDELLLNRQGVDLNAIDCSRTCYAELSSTVLFRSRETKEHVQLRDFNRRATSTCGNYSKAINCLENVDFVGVHTPESCRFYPRGERFSAKTATFVHRFGALPLVHLVNMWNSSRYARLCDTVQDSSLA
jgi:hypothetical protein